MIVQQLYQATHGKFQSVVVSHIVLKQMEMCFAYVYLS